MQFCKREENLVHTFNQISLTCFQIFANGFLNFEAGIIYAKEGSDEAFESSRKARSVRWLVLVSRSPESSSSDVTTLQQLRIVNSSTGGHGNGSKYRTQVFFACQAGGLLPTRTMKKRRV